MSADDIETGPRDTHDDWRDLNGETPLMLYGDPRKVIDGLGEAEYAKTLPPPPPRDHLVGDWKDDHTVADCAERFSNRHGSVYLGGRKIGDAANLRLRRSSINGPSFVFADGDVYDAGDLRHRGHLARATVEMRTDVRSGFIRSLAPVVHASFHWLEAEPADRLRVVLRDRGHELVLGAAMLIRYSVIAGGEGEATFEAQADEAGNYLSFSRRPLHERLAAEGLRIIP